MDSENFIRTVQADELPHGATRAVEIGGKSLLLCNWNGRIYAIVNQCSHAAEKLECGRLGNGWIACPVHGARFDLATGRAKNPPAKQPIQVFQTRIEAGWIEVSI